MILVWYQYDQSYPHTIWLVIVCRKHATRQLVTQKLLPIAIVVFLLVIDRYMCAVIYFRNLMVLLQNLSIRNIDNNLWMESKAANYDFFCRET